MMKTVNDFIDRVCIYSKRFYNESGKIEDPKLRFHGHEVSKDVLNYFTNFIEFILESDFLSDATKIYFKGYSRTRGQAIECYNYSNAESERLDVKIALSQISLDLKKLIKYFDTEMFINILEHPEEYLARYRRVLELLKREFNTKYDNAIAIIIDKEKNCTEMCDEEFNELVRFLDTYSNKKVNHILEDAEEHFEGYLNYLISSITLNSKDIERLQIINELLLK